MNSWILFVRLLFTSLKWPNPNLQPQRIDSGIVNRAFSTSAAWLLYRQAKMALWGNLKTEVKLNHRDKHTSKASGFATRILMKWTFVKRDKSLQSLSIKVSCKSQGNFFFAAQKDSTMVLFTSYSLGNHGPRHA